jgi:uncharacterized protein YcnI
VPAATAIGVVVAFAAPASAHVEMTPDSAAPQQSLIYTVSVPNEHSGEATVELDLNLPPGFDLEAAQQVPGWTTQVLKSPDGTPTTVIWKGGRIPPDTFGTFEINGRNPNATGPLVFQAVQRYERSVVRWTGPESSETPAPVVQLSATPSAASQPAAPTASSSTATSNGADRLARSRADFAVALGVMALLLALGAQVLPGLRRRQEARALAQVDPAGGAQGSGSTPNGLRTARNGGSKGGTAAETAKSSTRGDPAGRSW